MAIRTIEYTVYKDGIFPKTEQRAGVQNEHLATELKYSFNEDFATELKNLDNLHYRFELYDGAGGMHTSRAEKLDLQSNAIISKGLSQSETCAGGKLQLYLVISQGTHDAEMIIYSFPAYLTLEPLPYGTAAVEKAASDLSLLIEYIKNVAVKASIAANKAEDGESIIIGDKESNTAGTKGFRIFKAQRVTQNDGGYHYFYYLAGATDELLAQFRKVLTANPDAKYTLRNYYITNSFTLNKEYTDDQAETYEVTKEDDYLKVRVGDVKRTFQPIPEDPNGVPLDGIKDENGNYRYVWKPAADSNVYEMDFTDTWDYKGKTEYSYFRLAVAPDLGTEWLETNSLVAGGSNNKALGKDSFTAGSDNISNGSKAVTLGDENYANYSALAAGKQNKALNKYDVALGYKNVVDSFAGFAAGNANEVKHSFSAAIGNNLKTQNGNQILLGRYNKNTHDKNVVLSVGAGWDEASRRDAMTIFHDGEVRTLGKVVAAGVDLNAEIASAQRVANEAKTIATDNTKEITALKSSNTSAQKDIDNLKNVLETVNERTTLKLGELPITGEVDKLYIVEKDDNVEQYVYKVRKTPKVENVWKGDIFTTAPNTLKGTGTEEDPYQITNGDELSYIVKYNRGSYCKLMNDIYLNDISDPNWKDNAKSWVAVESNKHYYGVFDGCNHTIYGLYYNNPTDADSPSSYIGSALFPFINNNFSTTPIVIKNLGLDYAYVSSSSNAGALVGVTQSSNYEISNCWIGKNVELLGCWVASISTWGNGKALIENCYSLATQNNIEGATRNAFVQANSRIFNPTGAGKVTDNLATIKNCYCLNGKLTYSKSNLQTVENCYCTAEGGWGTVIDKEDMTGIDALENMSNLGEAFVADYTYPQLKTFVCGWLLIDTTDYAPIKEELKSYIEESLLGGAW